MVSKNDHEPGWEYLYFASLLEQGIAKNKLLYEDHLRRSVRHNRRLLVNDPATDVSKRADALKGIIQNAARFLNSSTLGNAFQTHPEKASIRRIAERITETYLDLLGWAQSTREAYVPGRWKPVYEALGEYPDLSIQRVREFVAEIRRQAEDIAAAQKAGQSHRPLSVTLKFDIGDAAVDKFNKAMQSLSSTKPTQQAGQTKKSPSAAEEKRSKMEARLAEVEAMNRKLNKVADDLTRVLISGLSIDPLESLNETRKVFTPRALDPSILPPKERPPLLDDFLPKVPGGLLGVLPKVKRQHHDAEVLAQTHYQTAMRQYEDGSKERAKKIAEIELSHKTGLAKEKDLVDKHNADLDAIFSSYESGDRDGIVRYFGRVLNCGPYPPGVWQSNKIVYVPESKQLVIEQYFPTIDVIPAVREYKYVRANDKIQETARPTRERQSMYLSLISQVTLRIVREVFESDKKSWVESLVFNGHVSTIDPGTGQSVAPCLVTLRVTREVMDQVDLAKVDPVACLKTLNAGVSKSPSELVPVRPVLEFSMVDPRFVQEADVLSELDQRPNLMELTPTEFESLITNLFEKMGLETRQTRPSRDGGVDCVAYDPRPVLGGKVVIQAKRYKNTVGVSAVRDLFGTVHNEGASKGILVTTSGYGKKSFEFANGKPLELLSGSHLLFLLSQHAGIEAKIEVPEDWVDPTDEDV